MSGFHAWRRAVPPGDESAAAVEMLKVLIAPPPVPHVSTQLPAFGRERPSPAGASERRRRGSLCLAFDAQAHEERGDLTGVASRRNEVERVGQLVGSEVRLR
jgi:hypothetical protein